MRRLKKRSVVKLVVAAVLLGVIGIVGGPYVYIHFIKEKAPPPFTFDSLQPTDSAVAGATTVAGTGH